MSFPGHLDRLRKSQIEREISRHAERIAIACFARFGIAEALIRLIRIAAEEPGWLEISARRARFDFTNACAVALNVPVRRPGGCVEWSADRVSGIPPHDARKLPIAEDCVDRFVTAER